MASDRYRGEVDGVELGETEVGGDVNMDAGDGHEVLWFTRQGW